MPISYDDRQREARLVTWLCCRRTVYAVDPAKGCCACWWRLRVAQAGT
jgi:hypothetical protein